MSLRMSKRCKGVRQHVKNEPQANCTHLDMSHPMIVEIWRGCELLTADQALMGFFAAVDALMSVQWTRGWETLVAHHADMRFLPFNLIPILNYCADPSFYTISGSIYTRHDVPLLRARVIYLDHRRWTRFRSSRITRTRCKTCPIQRKTRVSHPIGTEVHFVRFPSLDSDRLI